MKENNVVTSETKDALSFGALSHTAVSSSHPCDRASCRWSPSDTCLQCNEAGERVSSRMVRTGKSVLFSTSTSKAFWMESNNCSMSLLVSTASLLLFSFGCFRVLC